MIECPKCGGLNTKESKICGNCGAELEYHDGIRLIKKLPDEKTSFDIYNWISIILSFVLLLIFFLVPNFLISGLLAFICLTIARRRNSTLLEVVSWFVIGLIGAFIAIFLIVSAWGF